jgi:hypothetical protein
LVIPSRLSRLIREATAKVMESGDKAFKLRADKNGF